MAGSVAYWNNELTAFLEDNKNSSVISSEEIEDQAEGFAIKDPWNDASLIIKIDEEDRDFTSKMNSIILTERFSAIWHKDTKDLEVIFQAFPLAKPIADLRGRIFTFRFGLRSYECEFAPSSLRLEAIAKNVVPVQSSKTNYRNLQSFKTYFSLLKDENTPQAFIEACQPLSFFIRKIDHVQDEMISTIAHLNFFMSYFDRRTPTVVIHPPKIKRSNVAEQRYVAGRFPSNITARSIDDNLLHYWEAASQGDQARRFLYYYRIIEYSASVYVDQGNRAALKRALSAPNALDDIDRISDEVMNITARIKMDEYARMEAMLKEYVAIQCLWGAIEKNRAYFAAEQVFEGGFIMPAIASEKMTINEFSPSACMTFVRSIKDIRNALSHGKDQKTQSVIIPTSHNLSLLQPWVVLIACAAGDLILYRP
jgi:hypothetical protein